MMRPYDLPYGESLARRRLYQIRVTNAILAFTTAISVFKELCDTLSNKLFEIPLKEVTVLLERCYVVKRGLDVEYPDFVRLRRRGRSLYRHKKRIFNVLANAAYRNMCLGPLATGFTRNNLLKTYFDWKTVTDRLHTPSNVFDDRIFFNPATDGVFWNVFDIPDFDIFDDSFSPVDEIDVLIGVDYPLLDYTHTIPIDSEPTVPRNMSFINFAAGEFHGFEEDLARLQNP